MGYIQYGYMVHCLTERTLIFMYVCDSFLLLFYVIFISASVSRVHAPWRKDKNSANRNSFVGSEDIPQHQNSEFSYPLSPIKNMDSQVFKGM